MNRHHLAATAQALVQEGKGILAADESSGTIKRRLDRINVPSTEDNRRAYRELLFTTPGIEAHLSGIILFDETMRQSAQDGTPFPRLLENRGIIPGIKVDQGAKDLAGFPGELVTEGLDGLRERLAEYRQLGAGFTKWRAVITIGPTIPSSYCIEANAHALARFAALCQEAGLAPIVEPDVLMDSNHSIERCEAVTSTTLQRVFTQLHAHQVMLEGMLLKPNMVLAGKDCPQQASVDDVAEATIRCFRRVVPTAMPGIVFLSGGQRAEQATAHLNAMNAMGEHPWQISFSYGRALQGPVLEAWQGNTANIARAQAHFQSRAKLNSTARYGKYTSEMENATV